MTNEKGFAAYALLGHVADDMVVDALLPEDRGAGVAPVKKERPRRLSAFFESGWGVAIICALVAVSVMGGIIWAGNQPGTGVPPGGTVEPESQTTDENMMPPLYEEPNRTMLLVWSDGIGCKPKRFMVWSELNYMDKNGMGQGTTADGLGFLGTIRQEGEKLDLPKASFIREIASQNGRIYGISLDPEYILRQVTVYDMNLTEVYTESITESWETWDYVGCMNALASGEYYVSFYVTHDGSESLGDVHNCGQDYAFILSVTDTAETTRSCTVKTDKDRYEWGNPYYFTATLTSTVEGAYLQVDDPDAWLLVNLDTGERGSVGGIDTPYDTLIAPASPASYASSSYPLYFDWKTTPPGRYRLTYTGIELGEGEVYPFCDFEIYEPPLQSDVHILTFLYCSDTFLRDDYFVEEQHDGGGLSSAIYEREMMVEQAVGVELLYHDGGDFLNYGDELKTSVLAGDDTYAVVMTHNVYGITDLMTASILTDLAEMDERQEIHLNADYWDKAIMEDVSLGGHLFVGYNDFLLPNHHMVVFNRSMYAPYVDTEGNLYDHVRAGDWTLEKMADVSALVSGQNADGEIVYGFGSNGGQQLFAFVPAGGVKVVDKKDDGIPYVAGVADTHDRWASLIEWVYDLCNADNAYDWQENLVSPGQNHNILSSGRVLLSLASTSEYRLLHGRAETYGVLPYPKYDKAQAGYHTLYYGGMLGVTTAVRDTAVVGRTLDLLARHAQPVHTAFAETVLGMSAKDAPDDIQMLEIMEDTMTSDLIYVVYNEGYGDPLFNCMFRRLTAWNKEQTAEVMQSAAKQYDRYLGKIYEKVADD